jgi:hypothetical protein
MQELDRPDSSHLKFSAERELQNHVVCPDPDMRARLTAVRVTPRCGLTVLHLPDCVTDLTTDYSLLGSPRGPDRTQHSPCGVLQDQPSPCGVNCVRDFPCEGDKSLIPSPCGASETDTFPSEGDRAVI